jgi:hypothetical protein
LIVGRVGTPAPAMLRGDGVGVGDDVNAGGAGMVNVGAGTGDECVNTERIGVRLAHHGGAPPLCAMLGSCEG